jgi:uncharacterized protein (TIGR03435 family)
MNEILNHLLQSTLFAAAVAVANTTLRRNSPRLRYWLWLAASIKFLIPFSLLVSTGARVQFPPDMPSLHAVTVQQMSTYFAPISEFPAPAPTHQGFQWPLALAAIWVAGALFLLIRWFHRWRTIHLAVVRATQLPLRLPLQALSSPSTMEPGIFGIFRPVLLLPEGIDDSLTPKQFEAVLAHELRHARYRDNLTAALHMCVETLFWFHPVVWWIGAQLMAERERDCDEAVLMQGSRPGDYARGIVQVCEAYVESPLACAAGISGSDLKKRIREIMTWRGSLPVTRSGNAMLAVAAVAAVSLPFALGVLRAQTLPPAPTLTYDAVSIHKTASGTTSIRFSPGPQGGMRTLNTSAVKLIAWAYQVEEYQILDAPGWASSQGYDVTFTPDKSEAAFGDSPTLKQLEGWQQHTAQRTQAVLRDRFGLVLRSETRELPIFNLTQAKGGPKLAPHPGEGGVSLGSNGHQITGNGVTIGMSAVHLSALLGRPVRDETHINGEFDFKVTPDSDGPMSESLFTALPEQLGLRLESAKGPVQVYVVEKIERPGEN